MNPYEVLGVASTASAEEVRAAYLRLARTHHPDYHATASAAEREDAERRMRSVNEAWAALGDPARRADHHARHAEEGPGFVPFDLEDDPDPLDQPDIPYRPAAPSNRSRVATMAPIVVFAASVGVLALGLVLDAVPMLGLAALLFVASCVGFLVLPLLALARASRDGG